MTQKDCISKPSQNKGCEIKYVKVCGKLEKDRKEILGTCRSFGLVSISFFFNASFIFNEKVSFQVG